MAEPLKEPMPRYAVGQPVTCVMFPGPWVVHDAREIKLLATGEIFFRYWVRNGDVYEGDIPEVWLSPLKARRPMLRLVSDNTRGCREKR